MASTAARSAVALCLAFLLAGLASAQVDPPSWWNQNDGLTSSFSWTFDTNAYPPVATIDLAPFGEPSWSKDGRTAWFEAWNGHDGVWGVPAGGEGTIDVRLYNSENAGYVKHMWAQVDFYAEFGSQIQPQFSTAPGTEIVNLVTSSVDLENGWKRGTATWDIVPQPGYEDISFTFSSPAGTNVGAYIDNFYAGSHCVTSVPSPVAIAPFALGLLAALRRRRSR